MNRRDSRAQEQDSIEKMTIEYFHSTYNAHWPNPIVGVSHRDRPDAIITHEDGSERGLEATTLFVKEGEAPFMLGRSRSNQLRYRPEDFQNSAAIVNKRILEKVAKIAQYPIQLPVDLVILVGSPMFDADNVFAWDEDLDLSKRGIDRIWFLTQVCGLPGWPSLSLIQRIGTTPALVPR